MRATLAADVHDRGEYLRVDEVARRFDVSIDDVLASCSVLGFAADGPTSLIDIVAFTDAIKDVADRKHAGQRRAQLRRVRLVSAAASVAIIVAALGASVLSGHGASGSRTPTARQTAAAYRAELQSTYRAVVGTAPTPADYQALAQRWAQITPPAAMRAEHTKLISDAQHVATLSDNPAPASPAAPTQAAAAADALHAELDSVGGQTGVTTP